MQIQDPTDDPAIQASDPPPQEAAAEHPAERRDEPRRRDEPWASGQRKRYLASLPETPEVA